ncbi:MAG: cysteine--tRNA ligase [Candidatus Nanopelagicales bacterium]|nr:cysteine--tRNA ligase [Candidatus Nanopelagicales bacterium]MCF8537921.1 cysteine--tRNA ligase [Candidatus Nanopelagicales bacterium]MCF8556811.1 cysteine--tRNA ligase [Candidatus Nanopelagicales bacterium]
MALRFYDTASRSVRDFVPLQEGKAGIYLCGATVQAPPHIGHIRSGVAFDVIRRWLTAKGYDVTFVRNVTDIDDKILARGTDEGVPYWDVAMRNERAFTRAYDVLGCLPPTYEPRATGHVPEMIALMQRLIDTGHGYAAAGDVYFDVRSYPAYGDLSGQRPDDMKDATDADPRGKRDARDFAMWKSAKAGEPAWDTPWGFGRPGWHIECSAMAAKYLGDSFDIHGGGLDLVFPHHENEIAQSKAAGQDFAQYWLHNAWVTTAGEKMSKSLGNSLLVDQVVQRVRPVELRYYLAGAHYRSMLEYSDEHVAEAGQGYRRIEGFLERAQSALGLQGTPDVDPTARPSAFDEAMDDDIAVPQALAVLHETVREGNAALADDDLEQVQSAFAAVLAMVDVLGINPWSEPWAGAGSDGREAEVIDALVQVVLQQRQDARARKDFAAADAIRDGLDAIGIKVEDTGAGVRWSLN